MKRLKVEHRAIERMKDQESPRSTSNNGRGEKKKLRRKRGKIDEIDYCDEAFRYNECQKEY